MSGEEKEVKEVTTVVTTTTTGVEEPKKPDEVVPDEIVPEVPEEVVPEDKSALWMHKFENSGMTEPSSTISGKGAKGLFSKLSQASGDVSKDNGNPHYVDDYAVRWIPEGQKDPSTGELNAGVSCWRGGL